MGRKNKDFDFNILTSGYAAKVKVLDQNLYLTNRVHSYDTNQVHVETFGSNWILAFAKDIPLGKIAIRSNKNILPLEGNIAILIPPFFIAEWHIKKGPFSWYSLSSSNELKEYKFSDDHDLQEVLRRLPGILVNIDALKNYSELY